MRTLPIGIQPINFNSTKAKPDEIISTKEVLQPKANEIKDKSSSKKITPLVTATLAVVSLGFSVYALKGRSGEAKQAVEEAKSAAKQVVTDVVKEAKKVAKETATAASKSAIEAEKSSIMASADTAAKELATLKTEIEALGTKIDQNQKWNDGYFEGLRRTIDDVKGRQVEASAPREKFLAYVDGKTLLQNVDNSGNRITLKEPIIKELKLTAQKYMTGKDATGAAVTIAALGAGSTVWLPTAESLPEKEGGLAEVPVQMAMNMDKMDINNYIVRPLMEVPGKTRFYSEGSDYYYYYPGLEEKVTDEATGRSRKEERPIKLEKVVDFETKVFRNGHYETQPVEVFYGEDSIRGYKRLMFRNKDYFTASGLYKGTQMVSEAERYAFFNKIMYDFMKLKMDSKSIQGYNVPNRTLFDQIKAPDAVVLNDWHCGPAAALLRYKTILESEAGELNKSAAQKLRDMNLLYIVHNSDYQGDDWRNTSEILNTLFDKYTLDIYETARTRFVDEDNHAIDNLENVLTIDGNVNMANMGMCLANMVKPVSKTYATEMATRPERSRGLMHVTGFRIGNGTLEGASNGWDRTANEIALETKPYNDTVAMINKDISFITDVVKKYPEFKFDIPEERSVKPVTSLMDINEIMANRKHNKMMFVDYLKTSLSYNQAAMSYNESQKDESKKVPLINFDLTGVSDLSDVDINNLDNIPVLTMGVRFVEQKGVDIATKSLIDLYRNWETFYPGKELPIVVIGGEDPTGRAAVYRTIAQKAKSELGELGKRLLYMDGFTPNPAFYAGSDYTLRPSHFEPDGDKWESLYRGTPMLMTRVGGHVDSIKDGINGFLSRRTVSQICEQLNIEAIKWDGKYDQRYLDAMSADYTETIKRGLDAFYNKKQYQNLVDNAIHGNQSWVQYDDDGKIVECPLVGHMRDLGFDFSYGKLANLFADSVKRV